MPPVISIVGKSDSGKTTLIEKLLPALKSRGYRVGTIKHASHGFQMDTHGKDSSRHRQAGAEVVMVVAPTGIAMIKDGNTDSLAQLLPFFSGMDLVITEGFKAEKMPKIEVFRASVHRSPACLYDATLQAIVSDSKLDVTLPTFGFEQIDKLVDWIVGRFLTAVA